VGCFVYMMASVYNNAVYARDASPLAMTGKK